MMLPKGTRVPTGDLQESEAVSGKKYMSGGTFEQKTGTLPDYKGTSPVRVDYVGGIPGQIRIKIPTGRFVSNDPDEQVFIMDGNYSEENIVANKSIFGLTGTFTADATATAADIAKDKIAYVNGEKITGTMEAFAPTKFTIQTNAQSFYQSGDNYVLTFDTSSGSIGPNLLGVTVNFMNEDVSWEYEDGKSLDISKMTFDAFKVDGNLVADEQHIDLGNATLSVQFGGADIQGSELTFDILFSPSTGTFTINQDKPMLSVDVWSY